jgi:hypothetical protein
MITPYNKWAAGLVRYSVTGPKLTRSSLAVLLPSLNFSFSYHC